MLGLQTQEVAWSELNEPAYKMMHRDVIGEVQFEDLRFPPPTAGTATWLPWPAFEQGIWHKI